MTVSHTWLCQRVPLSGQCTQCPRATLQEAGQVDAMPIVCLPNSMCWDQGSMAMVGHAAKKLLSPLTVPPAHTDVAVGIGLAASIWALSASKLCHMHRSYAPIVCSGHQLRKYAHVCTLCLQAYSFLTNDKQRKWNMPIMYMDLVHNVRKLFHRSLFQHSAVYIATFDRSDAANRR